MTRGAVHLLVFLASFGAVVAKDAPGYIVSGHWKGGQIPKLEWELDLRRHDDREGHGVEDIILKTVIPTRSGIASLPSFTAFEPENRTFYVTASKSSSSASLFSATINAAVDNTTTAHETVFHFPAGNALVGLQALAGPTLLACFNDGSVVKVDPTTGVTTPFASLIPTGTSGAISTAITLDRKTGTLFAVYNNSVPNRQIASLDIATAKVTTVALKPLKYHDPKVEQPFQAVWLDGVQQLLVFYAGFEKDMSFDQIIFADAKTGALVFMWKDLTQVPSISPPPYPAQIEMQFEDHCKEITGEQISVIDDVYRV
jgi:hypothetical protein